MFQLYSYILGLLTYDISFIASIADSNMEKHELVNLKADIGKL